MRKLLIALLVFLTAGIAVSCNDYETYGDKKKKERAAIQKFLRDSAIVVIDEAKFAAQGNTTDVAKNEFVLLDNEGVYMQIVNKGCGEPIHDGEQTDLLVRFYELSIMEGDTISNQDVPGFSDVMNVRRSGSTYTGMFTSGYITYAYQQYGVPFAAAKGILLAFQYLNVGRPRSADDQIAKVRLIVPHTQGHAKASNYVYPYYYEFTFQRKTDFYDTY